MLLALLPLAVALPVPKAAEQVEYRRPNIIQSSSSSSHHNCKPCAESSSEAECCPDFHQEAIFLQHDVGFYHFDFPAGNSEAVAFRTFYFSYPYETILNVVDCFCSGDRFLVNGQQGGIPFFEQSTSTVPIDRTCSAYETEPFTCLTSVSPQWSSLSNIRLNSGPWNFTILPTVTPFLAGTGYIYLQKAGVGTAPECADPSSPLYPCVWSVYN